MISNFNNTTTPCEMYRPPQMRAGFIGASITKGGYSEFNNNEFPIRHSKIPRYFDRQFQSNNNNNELPTRSRKSYFDRKFQGSVMEYNKILKQSSTLYIGHLNLASTEVSIRKLFSNAGNIKTVIMGLKKKTLAPAGFCFVEFETREAAENCINNMIDIVLDGEKLVIDWDAGFTEGRQYERINRSKRYKSKYRNTKNVNPYNGHSLHQ